MGRTWEKRDMYTRLLQRNFEGRKLLEDTGINGKVILNHILKLRKIGWEDVNWIKLTQNKVQ
jgi:hypothetical protein